MSETLNSQEVIDNRQIGEVAASLAGLLQRDETVAYVIGLKQGRTVRNWIEKGSVPRDPQAETKLKLAEKLALTVKDESRPWVSGAWLIAANPHLGENSPTVLIRSLRGDTEDAPVIEKLQFAADHFAALED